MLSDMYGAGQGKSNPSDKAGLSGPRNNQNHHTERATSNQRAREQ